MEDRITAENKTGKIKNAKRVEQGKRLALISKEAKAKKAREKAENLKTEECYKFDIKPAAVCGFAVFRGFLVYKYFLVLNKKNLKKNLNSLKNLKKLLM